MTVCSGAVPTLQTCFEDGASCSGLFLLPSLTLLSTPSPLREGLGSASAAARGRFPTAPTALGPSGPAGPARSSAPASPTPHPEGPPSARSVRGHTIPWAAVGSGRSGRALRPSPAGAAPRSEPARRGGRFVARPVRGCRGTAGGGRVPRSSPPPEELPLRKEGTPPRRTPRRHHPPFPSPRGPRTTAGSAPTAASARRFARPHRRAAQLLFVLSGAGQQRPPTRGSRHELRTATGAAPPALTGPCRSACAPDPTANSCRQRAGTTQPSSGTLR